MLKEFKDFAMRGNVVDEEALLTEIRDLLAKD
jgi:large-conductance mechanosensitive channel